MNILQRIGYGTKQFVEAVWSSRDPTWYAQNGYMRMYEMLGGGMGTSSGMGMNVPLAMTCPAVYICTRAITESLSSMPLSLLRKQGEMTTEDESTPLYGVLSKRPNSYQTTKTFRRTIAHHALNYGNGYARIVRRGGKPDEDVIGLHILHPRSVRKRIENNGDFVYLVNQGQSGYALSGYDQYANPTSTPAYPIPANLATEERLKDSDVFHIMNYSDDGFTGVGAIQSGREEIALAMAIQRFGSAFFARGGVPAGMIVKELPFKTKEDRETFKQDWSKEYEGFQGFFKKMLVEGGSWKFEKFGLSPADSQLTDAQAASVPAIARYYGITPHLAGDLTDAHFNNVEHLWTEFLQITLMPWIVGFEQEVERVLLTDKQRADGYYAKHNVSAFMRGDFQARMEGYSTLLQNGVLSIDEVRELEDLDPLPDGAGKSHHIQLNMQTVPGSGQPTPAELIKISSGRTKVPVK